MKTRLIVSVLLAGLLAACGAPRVLFGGTHGAPDTPETPPAQLDEHGLRLLARKLVRSLANVPRFARPGPRLPVVRVGQLENRTSESIDLAALGDELQTGLAQTGRFSLSAAGEPGSQASADYLLTGGLTSSVQRTGSDTLVYYRVTATLNDVRTGRVAWRDEKEVRRKSENVPVTW
ncbi:penicillin-binding protein activator LpoB [Archangium sp.]|uniref:penicillin-binding protein activator LpoB n=1 Tax=Archangium sp. TaxID=1872627 RepID=UPI00389A4D13